MRAYVDEFYDGKGGRFVVTRSLEPGAKLFQIENDESGSVLATTVNRAAAVEMATPGGMPFTLKPLKQACRPAAVGRIHARRRMLK